MGTKNNPGSYDCYHNAAHDEPMFILLARDPGAPQAVRAWAEGRKMLILTGVKPTEDLAMVKEAEDCAAAMEQWAYQKRISKQE